MTAPNQPLRARFCWRWLADSPLVLATWASVAMGLVAIVEVAHALRDADRVRARSTVVLAELAAEAAVVRLAKQMPVDLPVTMEVGRVPVTIANAPDGWRVTAAVPSGLPEEFECQILPGASPAALGMPLTVATAGVAADLPGAVVGPFPVLENQLGESARRAETLAAFRRDVGMALMHFSAGTELDDFVVDTNVKRLGLPPRAACVLVSGHLWIEPGSTPWRVFLEHDLTLVVSGNLYVGRSVVVDGPGRLVFVVQGTKAARGFADLDGNGRWSPGDRSCEPGEFVGVAEGGGNVHLGLATAAPVGEVQAGLVVAGELHLRSSIRVDGPVVLQHGVVGLGQARPRLLPTGERLFAPEREVVPGFALSGGARPGLLRSRSANRRPDEVPLYAAAPGR